MPSHAGPGKRGDRGDLRGEPDRADNPRPCDEFVGREHLVTGDKPISQKSLSGRLPLASGTPIVVREEELRQLMIGSLDGCSSDYASLLRHLVPILHDFYLPHVSDSDGCSRLVQETLADLHQRRGTYDRERPFTSWLFAIARYKMSELSRKSSAQRPVLDLEGLLREIESMKIARMERDRLCNSVFAEETTASRADPLQAASVRRSLVTADKGDTPVSAYRGLKLLLRKLSREDEKDRHV